MRRSIAGAALGLLLASGVAKAQTYATDDSVLRRIWAIGMDSSQTWQLSQALFDSAGVFICKRYISWTMRPSSRTTPFFAKKSLTGSSRIFAITVLASSLPAASTAFR